MTTSPILDEIHKIRLDYAERFGNDLHAICQDARQKQGRDGRQVIPANPKPASNLSHNK
ncbi:MAG: hypothetical protein ABFS56_28840 [Pseudomonadota bacterium]